MGGGFGDRGLGLEAWLRVAVDGSNRFGRVRWLRKIRIGGRFGGYGRPLFGLQFWGLLGLWKWATMATSQG
ncbi:hypothetical protein BHE74_00014622 [Ensete ventricosum]|nr:hypothetical protein BHE74_00014622 [Ensete ventricosum]